MGKPEDKNAPDTLVITFRVSKAKHKRLEELAELAGETESGSAYNANTFSRRIVLEELRKREGSEAAKTKTRT